MITWENYEEYMMMDADGELQPHEAEELRAFIAANPQLKNEMDLYASVRLTPDMTQVYEHKDELLKKEPARRIAFIPRYRSYGIAAGVAALIALSYFGVKEYNMHTDITGSQVAVTSKPSSTNTQQAGPVVNKEAQLNNDTTVTANQVATTNPGTVTTNTVNTAKNTFIKKSKNITHVNNQADNRSLAQHKQHSSANTPLTHEVRLTEEMAAVPQGGMRKLPVTATVAGKQQQVSMPEEELPVNEQTKSSWIDKLPLGEANKDKLTAVANTVANGAGQVSNLKQDIADRKLTVRLEKRKLTFSF